MASRTDDDRELTSELVEKNGDEYRIIREKGNPGSWIASTYWLERTEKTD